MATNSSLKIGVSITDVGFRKSVIKARSAREKMR